MQVFSQFKDALEYFEKNGGAILHYCYNSSDPYWYVGSELEVYRLTNDLDVRSATKSALICGGLTEAEADEKIGDYNAI